MKIDIRNFRGVKSATIELSRLTLIAGINFAGKSSIAHAIAAALSGETVPLAIKKTEAGMLVHAGTGKGLIDVEADNGARITIDYPQAKMKTEGVPPASSAYAAGLASILDLDSKQRATVLLEYLKATPSDGDILAKAQTIGLNDGQAAQLVEKIAKLGWDGAHAAAKETGAKLKGQWEAAAGGERYGSDKASKYIPPNWDQTLEGASEDGLQAELTQAREFLEAAIATAAVSDDERARLADWAGKVHTLRDEIATARAVYAKALEVTTAAKAAHQALPAPATEEKQQACPHCSGALVIRGGVAVKPTAIDQAENARRRAALEAAHEAFATATTADRAALDAIAGPQEKLKAAEAAAIKLAKLPPASDKAADVEQAREGQAVAEKRLAAFKTKREADRIHAGIEINAAVQVMLAPDGLRLAKLRDAVATFNAQLDALCTVAAWDRVELAANDLAITYGGRPLVLCSESERFRARATVQAGMAAIDLSAAVVVDAADILDKAGRNGLMRMLLACERPALVCMTLPARTDVPNLGARGSSYWIENGVAQPAH